MKKHPYFILIILATLFTFCGAENEEITPEVIIEPEEELIEVSDFSPDKNTPKVYKGMTLVWNEEFDIDGKVDKNDWNFEEGFVRNSELQWYQEENTIIKNHTLVIEGKRETVVNPNYDGSSSNWRINRQTAEYTSSSITTQGKHSWKYGRIEIRAKIPTKKGAWPAIWTLGTKGEWPSCGEIDILELYRKKGEPIILANFAWGSEDRWESVWNTGVKPLSEFMAADSQWEDKFHVWRMDWDATNISIYLDNELLNSHSTKQKNVTNEFSNLEYPFDQEHFLLLNLAIGSNGGNPSKTEFPLKYEIDYVRVYQ